MKRVQRASEPASRSRERDRQRRGESRAGPLALDREEEDLATRHFVWNGLSRSLRGNLEPAAKHARENAPESTMLS